MKLLIVNRAKLGRLEIKYENLTKIQYIQNPKQSDIGKTKCNCSEYEQSNYKIFPIQIF